MNLTGTCALLPHYSLVRATGADARGFLQAQLTADLRELTPEKSLLAAWCNAKGRVQAIFRLFTRGEDIYLRLPAELVPLTLPRLKMFVLRSKVVLDVLADWSALGVSGGSSLEQVLGPLPGTVNNISCAGPLTVIRAGRETERFEIWGPSAEIEALGQGLGQAGVGSESENDWRLRDLEAGLPELHPATREAFTPHMLNLDLLGAVAFGKGCYPGQEVVAKTQHRGLAKRRMFLASCTGAVPTPGARVLAADGQHAGDVVEALATADGCLLSAVLMLEHATRGGLRLADSLIELQVQPPPYPLA